MATLLNARGSSLPDVMSKSEQNIPLREHFEQVYVIEGVSLGDVSREEFEKTMGEMLGGRIQYLETVETLPDRDASGNPVPDTGGRTDVLFAAHEDDNGSDFNAKRLSMRIRLLEDVLSTRTQPHRIHPERLMDYLSPLVRRLIEAGA